jgi:hypothetical protein
MLEFRILTFMLLSMQISLPAEDPSLIVVVSGLAVTTGATSLTSLTLMVIVICGLLAPSVALK